MNKLKALCSFLFLAGTIQFATAQTSVNNIQLAPGSGNTTPYFIDGISFTSDGILKITESGGTKSVKVEAVPVVTKSSPAQYKLSLVASIIEKLSTLQFKYAMMMNVEVESLKNLSLFSFVDNWFGTRYHMGGTTKNGIDCSALTSSLLLAVYGFVVPRTARMQYDATEHIKKGELHEGDLVFFHTHGRGRSVTHVGLYLDNDHFVHASSSQGVTISSLDDSYYANRFICGGRIEQD